MQGSWRLGALSAAVLAAGLGAASASAFTSDRGAGGDRAPRGGVVLVHAARGQTVRMHWRAPASKGRLSRGSRAFATSTNLIPNGDFAQGITRWGAYHRSPAPPPHRVVWPGAPEGVLNTALTHYTLGHSPRP